MLRATMAHLTRRHPLTGRYAARDVYGTLLVLALLLAVEDHTPGPWQAAVLVAGTLLTVLAAEVYAEILGMEIDLRRRLTGDERRGKLRELAVVVVAGEWPLLFLVAAGLGLIEDHTAFTLATTTSIVMLFFYGFLARRLSGRSLGDSLMSAAVMGLAGVMVAVLKAVVHG